jgi:hypothetical protein
MHQVRPAKSMKSCPDVIARMKLIMGEAAVSGPKRLIAYGHGAAVTNRPGGRRGRRPEHDDLFYALIAREYVRLCDNGERYPIKVLIQQRGAPRSEIERWVRTARDRGYLSGSTKGQAGGQLSQAAQVVLADNGDEGAGGPDWVGNSLCQPPPTSLP